MKKFLSIICSLAVLATCGVTTAFAEDVESTTENITEETVTETTTDVETNTEESYILGDANGDGVVDTKDAMFALESYATLIIATSKESFSEDVQNKIKESEDVQSEIKKEAEKEFYYESADVDKDGVVTAKDAAFMLLYYSLTIAHPGVKADISSGAEMKKYFDGTPSEVAAIKGVYQKSAEESQSGEIDKYTSMRDYFNKKMDNFIDKINKEYSVKN